MRSTPESSRPIAIAVLEHGDWFLVGIRGDGDALAGKAEFPGGKVEPHETPQEAAVRECREETGLDIRVTRKHLANEYAYEFGTLQLHFFSAELRESAGTGDEPLPAVNAPWQWVDRKRLGELDFPAGNAPVLQLLLPE